MNSTLSNGATADLLVSWYYYIEGTIAAPLGLTIGLKNRKWANPSGLLSKQPRLVLLKHETLNTSTLRAQLVHSCP